MQMNEEISAEAGSKSFVFFLRASQGGDQHCRARSGHQGWHLVASLCASRPTATLRIDKPAGLGMTMQDITLVINFDPPEEASLGRCIAEPRLHKCGITRFTLSLLVVISPIYNIAKLQRSKRLLELDSSTHFEFDESAFGVRVEVRSRGALAAREFVFRQDSGGLCRLHTITEEASACD